MKTSHPAKSASQTSELCRLEAASLAAAYRLGELSPVEVTRAALDRAEEIQEPLNAFTFLDPQGALDSARMSESRWRAGEPLSPIDGIPTTLKDIVYVQGWAVRYGSRATDATPIGHDSPSVARLRQAGAIFIGQTTTPEYGWKAVTDSAAFGVTRNPWVRTQTPGGSSGGAAAAAAAGAGVLHLGTDGGGSIRIPSAFTGIVGLKPSYGRVPAYPASAFGTVAHIGPMTRTVEDAAAMLNAMSGRDLRDWTQPILPFGDVELQQVNWSGKRIGYWKTPCVGGVSPEVEQAVEAVLRDVELAGAAVTEIRLPEQDSLLDLFFVHWYVGAANRVSTIGPELHDQLDPGFVEIARKGRRYSAIDLMQAQIRRAQFGARMDALLEEFDYVISPAVPIPAFGVGRENPEGSSVESSFEWSSFSFPINLSQQPACSVPCGFTSDGLPIGLQIIGARGGDASVLSAALTCQCMYPEHFMMSGGKWPVIAGGRD